MEGSGASLHAWSARQVHEACLDRQSRCDHRWRIMREATPDPARFSRRTPMLRILGSLPLSRLFAALAAVVLCACAARQPLGDSVAPPRFVVGDHWEYSITDGLRRG